MARFQLKLSNEITHYNISWTVQKSETENEFSESILCESAIENNFDITY